MDFLPGYHLCHHIYSGASSAIFRAERIADHQTFIIKLLTPEFPTPQELARFKHEYEMLRLLDSPYIIKAYELMIWRHQLAIVLEDMAAISLKELLTKTRLPLNVMLRLAINIASGIGAVHAAQMIHKDLCSYNILVNAASGDVKLIDFELAARFSRETPCIKHLRLLEGHLAYISPEQTGRMNRDIDARSGRKPSPDVETSGSMPSPVQGESLADAPPLKAAFLAFKTFGVLQGFADAPFIQDADAFENHADV